MLRGGLGSRLRSRGDGASLLRRLGSGSVLLRGMDWRSGDSSLSRLGVLLRMFRLGSGYVNVLTLRSRLSLGCSGRRMRLGSMLLVAAAAAMRLGMARMTSLLAMASLAAVTARMRATGLFVQLSEGNGKALEANLSHVRVDCEVHEARLAADGEVLLRNAYVFKAASEVHVHGSNMIVHHFIN